MLQEQFGPPIGASPTALLSVIGRHIIKGSSQRLPFVALNEHLRMQVTARVLPTAKTETPAYVEKLVLRAVTGTRSRRRKNLNG